LAPLARTARFVHEAVGGLRQSFSEEKLKFSARASNYLEKLAGERCGVCAPAKQNNGEFCQVVTESLGKLWKYR
jgi:hypothetical protein